MLAGLGRMSSWCTPPRYMGVWMFRPWALPGDVFFSTGPWSTRRWPSLMLRSATTRSYLNSTYPSTMETATKSSTFIFLPPQKNMSPSRSSGLNSSSTRRSSWMLVSGG
ncbi:hypothetical protein CRUP_015237 [Coryphaenoides rupestris]|nr:hypothetical protein CRUP_015237 [Coryphaenoides rupestris]